MGKSSLKNHAPNPDHIPGIYNYCDRWCERCQLTSRCLNYEINVCAYEDDVRELVTGRGPDAVESPAEEDTVTLVDSVEIIRWYQHQIYVKLQRAIHSSHDEEFDGSSLNRRCSDSRGLCI
jgi:hypothetical protein